MPRPIPARSAWRQLVMEPPSHAAGELFKMMTATNIIHVPYRGSGPSLTDLIAGQVQVAFGSLTSSIEHIRTGKLRALGVTTTTRAEALPRVNEGKKNSPQGSALGAFNWTVRTCEVCHRLFAKIF